jgi:RNA polymerase sigma-70 factor (ECF subfamily)
MGHPPRATSQKSGRGHWLASNDGASDFDGLLRAVVFLLCGGTNEQSHRSYEMNRSDERDSRSDEALVRAINAGDTSAFDVLYYRYRDWVVRLAFRFTRNREDALDVLQETFAYFFRKFPGFVLSARVTTFLYPVVRNLSIAHRHKRERLGIDRAIIEPVAMPDSTDAVQRDELTMILSSLPESQREVLLMRFVDDMSLLEIAGALGIPEGTVKSRIHNAIASLRADPRVRNYFGR